MKVFKLITRNTWRHPLRTTLTVLGLAIAVTAFCVIRTTIDAWYSDARATSPNILVTLNRVSLVFTLPMSSIEKVKRVEGVKAVSFASWFGGTYIDPKNFFAKFVVDHNTYFDLYPQWVVPPDQMEAFRKERNAVIVGRKLADRFGWKLGDAVHIVGDIYPGDWDFVIRGIYTGATEGANELNWFSRYDYLDERMRETAPSRAGQVGWLIVQIDDPSKAAVMSKEIDNLFLNSSAETKTQTEEAFALSFVEMSGTIISGLRIVSVLVIGVILLVLANTMAMTARERIREYAVLKTLGFLPRHLIGLIVGESIVIAGAGGVVGLLLTTFAVIPLLETALSDFLPVVRLTPLTLILGVGSALVVGFLAAVFPTAKAVRTSIVDGLRMLD
jgi:putative ABC transport system permease protein